MLVAIYHIFAINRSVHTKKATGL